MVNPQSEQFSRALALHQQGRFDEAEALYRSILKQHPANADTLTLLGTIQAQRGELDDAIRLFESALSANPRQLMALSNRAVAYSQMGRHREALDDFDAAIKLKSDIPDLHLHRGNALAELKRYGEALKSYERVVGLNPGHAIAFNNHGNTLAELGRHEEALQSYDRATAADPDYPEAHYNRGVTLKELGRRHEALRSYDRAIALVPDYAQAHYNRGLTLAEIKDHAQALDSLGRAVELNPLDAETFVSRGSVLLELLRLDEALASFERAIELDSKHSGGWNNRGNVLKALNRRDEALASYDRAITLKPDFAVAYANLGITLQEMHRQDDALNAFNAVLRIDPAFPYAAGQRIHAQMSICDWTDFEPRCAALNDSIARGERASTPFPVLTIPSTPAIQRISAQTYVADKYPPVSPAVWAGRRYSHERIRLGYFSADFYNHPTSFLMAGVLEQHDKSRFDVIGFSFGPDSDNDLAARLHGKWTEYLDVKNHTDAAIAQLACEREIDIAIDLWGYTRDFRTGIFARRPAPVQVNYLGYPGTMGAPYIDYIVADELTIPVQDAGGYTEHVVYMPDTYQPNDERRGVDDHKPARKDAGLPATGFVFCCFNNNYKITPDVFDVWMRLLGMVEGSVLWLLEDNKSVKANLTAEAHKRGIAAERLIFAPRVSLADHLARHQLADLFLDTFHYNAHTTGSDALWAGLPLITCAGNTFAGRVAASLLSAVGMRELITQSASEYEALALKLAKDDGFYKAIKQKLLSNRTIQPLFDTKLYTRNIETAYTRMHERHTRGEAPAQFKVRPA